MEQVLICMSLALGCGWMVLGLLTAGLLRQAMPDRKDRQEREEAALQELPEERESRRAAAEAQRLYEQGFVNLMRYDGRPGRKEGETL